MSSIEITDLPRLTHNVLVDLSDLEVTARIIGGSGAVVVRPRTRNPALAAGNNSVAVQPYNSAYSLSIATNNNSNSLTVTTGANFTANFTTGNPGSQSISGGVVYSYNVGKTSLRYPNLKFH
jgi:hypothetical protein